ncbi:EboA domain-containing protein [Saccharopolyspora sp. NFXS83]|uniref:EboA domain-containing protein n=1 Tax=Saccharopolyspora sp. NFXS83 TaxID=2993560 RepID=UPI00224ACB1D|nr:EboA domain-containing protein [Saccharopolyspora sp. NFXS83]MCX2729205.1 EboA domain-containing protein [Saccharopolyspora sp. NFXS83]
MTALRFGYGTNGFAHHRLDDALRLIADLGYDGVALTLDHHHLDPFAPDLAEQVRRVRGVLERLELSVVVETGARYLLDPHVKHHPTLVSDGSERRVDFLRRAVRVAADLGSEVVSFWSGIRPSDVDEETAVRRLVDGTSQVVEEAARCGVVLGLEPEPGMAVDTVDAALAVCARLGDPEPLGITLDVGHCVAVEQDTAAGCVRRLRNRLVHVQLDDMRPGVHEHLEFGEGELDLAWTLDALAEAGFTGLAAVELPRHGHAAPQVARRAIDALRRPWVAEALASVRREPASISTLFPAVGRHVGRGPVDQEDPDGLVHGTVDDQARGRLLHALAGGVDPARLAEELRALYRYGDDAERRGVLRALPGLDRAELIATGLELVRDALRTNDIRLVAAAMGPFARHLDDHAWRHGVLKCLFTGVPLTAVAGLRRRADDELRRMVADFAAERRAAGRDVPDDALALLEA